VLALVVPDVDEDVVEGADLVGVLWGGVWVERDVMRRLVGWLFDSGRMDVF
jgi:hypothetical protein